MSPLEVCDRVALAVGDATKSQFKDCFTSTTIEESSEKDCRLVLGVGGPDGRKVSVWAIAQISCSRKEAGVWTLTVWVQATVTHRLPSGQEALSVMDIVRKYRDLRLHARTTTEYHPGDREGETGLSQTEFSFPVADLEVMEDGMVKEAILEDIGQTALRGLVTSREIRRRLGAGVGHGHGIAAH